MPAADKSADLNLVEQDPRTFQPAVLASQTTILSSELSPSPELPLQPTGSIATLAVPSMSGAQNPLLVPGETFKDDSGVGAVRGAMGWATRKTADAFARVGTSMKRAF